MSKLETDWTLNDCLKFKVESKVNAIVADISGPLTIQDFFGLFMLITMCLDVWIQILLNNLWYVEQYGNIRAAILIQHIGCLNIEELACTLNVIRSQPFNCGQEDSWVQTAEQYVYCICLWCDHYGNHRDLKG